MKFINIKDIDPDLLDAQRIGFSFLDPDLARSFDVGFTNDMVITSYVEYEDYITVKPEGFFTLVIDLRELPKERIRKVEFIDDIKAHLQPWQKNSNTYEEYYVTLKGSDDNSIAGILIDYEPNKIYSKNIKVKGWN